MNERFYLGIKGRIVCLERETGKRVWETKLKNGQITNIILDSGSVLAHVGGELFCVDADSGQIKWREGLKGMGYGLATFASATAAPAGQMMSAIQQIRNQQATTAAG